MRQAKFRLFVSEITQWEVASIVFLSVAMAVGAGLYVNQQGRIVDQNKTINILRKDNRRLEVKQLKTQAELDVATALADNNEDRISVLEECIRNRCSTPPTTTARVIIPKQPSSITTTTVPPSTTTRPTTTTTIIPCRVSIPNGPCVREPT